MCITCVKYMQRPEEGIGFCGTAVADGSKPWMGAENCQSSKCSWLDLSYIIFLRCWGLNSGPHICHPSALLLSYIPLAQKPTFYRARTHTHKCTIEIHLDICSGELAIEVNLDRGIFFSSVVLSVLGIEYLDMRS